MHLYQMSQRSTRRRAYKAPPPEVEPEPDDSAATLEVTEALALQVEEVNGCTDSTGVGHENNAMQVDQEEEKGSEAASLDEGDPEPASLAKKRPRDSPEGRPSRFSLDVTKAREFVWKGLSGLRNVPLLNHLIPQNKGEASESGAGTVYGGAEEIHAAVVDSEGAVNEVIDKSENEHSEEGKRSCINL